MDDRGAAMKAAVGLWSRPLPATVASIACVLLALVKAAVLTSDDKRPPVLHEGAEDEAACARHERPRIG